MPLSLKLLAKNLSQGALSHWLHYKGHPDVGRGVTRTARGICWYNAVCHSCDPTALPEKAAPLFCHLLNSLRPDPGRSLPRAALTAVSRSSVLPRLSSYHLLLQERASRRPEWQFEMTPSTGHGHTLPFRVAPTSQEKCHSQDQDSPLPSSLGGLIFLVFSNPGLENEAKEDKWAKRAAICPFPGFLKGTYDSRESGNLPWARSPGQGAGPWASCKEEGTRVGAEWLQGSGGRHGEAPEG